MRTLAMTFAYVTALATLPLQAQSTQSTKATETAPLWEIHLDLQKTFASPLGQWGMAMLEQEEPGAIEKIGSFVEAVGLDPRTDIGEVVLYGNGFEETDATVVANLGQTTGNLEGWILAAPGYESEDLDSNTLLHSLQKDEGSFRAWCALPKDPNSGEYVLVASFTKDKTVRLAKQVLTGNQALVQKPLSGKSIFSFAVNDFSAIPIEVAPNDPGAAIVKIIEGLAFNVGSDSKNLDVSIDITTSSAGKARQVGQLLQGLKALVQLAPKDEVEVQQLAKLLEGLVVTQNEGQPSVQASLSAPYRVLEEIVSLID